MKTVVFLLAVAAVAGVVVASPAVEPAEAHFFESGCPDPDHPCTPVPAHGGDWLCHVPQPRPTC